jgi:hypothetical protein
MDRERVVQEGSAARGEGPVGGVVGDTAGGRAPSDAAPWGERSAAEGHPVGVPDESPDAAPLAEGGPGAGGVRCGVGEGDRVWRRLEGGSWVG